jgi:hypothetical protein
MSPGAAEAKGLRQIVELELPECGDHLLGSGKIGRGKNWTGTGDGLWGLLMWFWMLFCGGWATGTIVIWGAHTKCGGCGNGK